MVSMVEQYEFCWHTGMYDGQECSLCPHRSECSGSEMDDDDEDGDAE